MKNFLLFLFISSVGIFNANAQNETPAQVGWEIPVKFDKEVHDYGSMRFGADGTCTFTFTNTGKEPILIVSANASCGCTVPEYSKEPIAPGKSGTIKVTYDTKRVGAINKTVNLVFENASKTKSGSKVISIAGNVEAEAQNHDGHNH